MKKKESTLVNMVVVLFAITLAAGLTLGFVNDLTLAPKARARLAKKLSALQHVLPPFDNDPVSGIIRIGTPTAKDSIELYPAFQEGSFAGAAVTGVSEKGYSGLIKIMVGFQPDGRINNIEVLEQKETPGLGTKMKGEAFLRQFRGKNPETFDMRAKKDGGAVDALAGATITTRAFAEAAQQAYDAFTEHKDTLAKPHN
ncbi:RnfABCDGE type electron transport complex subunit G [Robiginitalea marina]|uniref:Ion-translocating oxidoreductase complex subunit G n=1 Tax=Robiginitalea marina TaxID=2954105 RepID=A0ABT1AXD0_9FLAO|nr:RnfABCDGE type electron transport complex subunit G [Robiginitalea marina]MCO5724584.1 RnfABCDGE type electron transport complex subunit G [Robiginitalea marina]